MPSGCVRRICLMRSTKLKCNLCFVRHSYYLSCKVETLANTDYTDVVESPARQAYLNSIMLAANPRVTTIQTAPWSDRTSGLGSYSSSSSPPLRDEGAKYFWRSSSSFC